MANDWSNWLNEDRREFLREIERRAAAGEPEAIEAVKEIRYHLDQLTRKVAWAEGKIPFTPDGDPSD